MNRTLYCAMLLITSQKNLIMKKIAETFGRRIEWAKKNRIKDDLNKFNFKSKSEYINSSFHAL